VKGEFDIEKTKYLGLKIMMQGSRTLRKDSALENSWTLMAGEKTLCPEEYPMNDGQERNLDEKIGERKETSMKKGMKIPERNPRRKLELALDDRRQHPDVRGAWKDYGLDPITE
jgi:hypothetical protein